MCLCAVRFITSLLRPPTDCLTHLPADPPPPSLRLKVKPKKLTAGQRATVTCQSRPSNPAANLTWWRDSQLVTEGVSRVTSKPSGDHGG